LGDGEPAVDERRKRKPVAHKTDLPHRTEDEQSAFFHAALERSIAAEAAAGTVERWFELAGFVLRVVFAGNGLVECFMPALAHLEIKAVGRADAVFHVWDSESTGVQMVEPLVTRECFTHRGDIWTMGSQRFKSAYLWSEYALNLFDAVAATGVYWAQAAGPLPYWAKAAPLRSLFHWWMETKDCQLLHAAAVGNRDEAVLITGKGGLGKSTTALSCLARGLQYLGDDYVVVQQDPTPRVHSLYNTGKVAWDQIARFPQFAGLARNPDSPEEDKAVMYLFPEMAGRIAKSLPLKAILTPCIGGRPQTELGRVSKSLLQRAAAFTTMSQLPHASRRTQDFVNRLVDSLPGLRITLGTDFDGIADGIQQLLERSAGELAALSDGPDGAGPPSQPLVSAIIPVHNGARFLPDSVASILAQNYAAIEIIVIDDGSTDEIDEAVRSLPVDVRFFKQPHSGPAAARNRGIREASGDFIAFLDVDDMWPEFNLRVMTELLSADPACDIVQGFGQLLEVKANTGKYDYVGNPAESFADCIAAALYRREAFEKVGLFDVDLRFGEDSDWFNRARECGLSLRREEQVTLLIRRHDSNMTRGRSNIEMNELRVLKRVLDRRRSAAARTGSEDRQGSPDFIGDAGSTPNPGR